MTNVEVEGTLTIRRSILIAATPERIWQEFESHERMSRWWGTGHRLVTFEPRVGGTIEMEVEVDGALTRFGGRITVFSPGRELTWEDNWIGPLAWSTTIFSTLRLTPAAGGTIVEFIKHGFERLGEQAGEVHRGLEGGWSITQLNALRRIVEADQMVSMIESPFVVRRSIFIAASPGRIWREFESHERMAAWWGVIREPPEIGKPNGMELLTYEPRAAGMVEMRIKNADGQWRFGGKITVFAPARELTFENDWFEPAMGWAAPTYITLRLTSAHGGTMVELLHHGFERTGKDAGEQHRGYEGGWGMLQLESLRALVEGA